MSGSRELPHFRYHPNLYELDILESFEGTCDCCGEAGNLFYQGMYTAEVVHELAESLNVEMPISDAIYNVIKGNITVEDAMETLMGRPMGYETDYL